MNQKQLKEKYMQVICKDVWQDKSMQDFCKKQLAYVVELSNGDIIDIDKPTIKKDFCFGMGAYATYTDEEMERAESAADIARTKEEYFISENLKQIDRRIEELKLCISGDIFETRECYTYLHYSGQPEDSTLVTYTVTRIGDNPEYNPMGWKNLVNIRKLEAKDVERIIAGYEEVKKSFEKRLNTYLKRYGLSKLNVWTYVRD